MTLAEPSDLLVPSRNCWRIEPASRVAVIVDAEDYFRHARAAMAKARRRIIMVGWDFDARITLDRSGADGIGPAEVGAFLEWLVANNSELEIFILRWDLGALKTLLNTSTLFTLVRWIRHPRISFQFDGHHPVAASHHQKIVVVDDDVAFCGGIDMTADRWDTRAHRDDEPGRRTPHGRRYKPWHDATTALEGPVAAALGDLCRERWSRAGRGELAPVTGGNSCWPDALVPHFVDADIAIARSAPAMDDTPAIVEVETQFVDLVHAARRWIYVESQYFASRRIALAIAERLAAPDCPEIVVINPHRAEGFFEPIAMDTARALLVQALRARDRDGKFRLYHPVTADGAPIYVHAKILIVDDRILRIGSSNLNNRSMRLDTECDVTLDAATLHDGGAEATIAAIRTSLVAEHLGVAEAEIAAAMAETGSLVATIERFRRASGRTLRPHEAQDLSAIESFLAENEILDPEGSDAMFDPWVNRGLFRGWRRHVVRRKRTL